MDFNKKVSKIKKISQTFQPIHYISHLMGHEGPGSILSTLKSRGWSNSLVAGARPTPRGFSFFTIAVDLTEEGMDHTDEIIQLVFQVIFIYKIVFQYS